MALQAPTGINFVDPGTPLSDATTLFLQSAKAAHAARLQKRAQDESERHDLVSEGFTDRNTAVNEGNLDLNRQKTEEEIRSGRRKEGIEDQKRDVEELASANDLTNPDSPNYNPTLAKARGQLTGKTLVEKSREAAAPGAPVQDAPMQLPGMPAELYMMMQAARAAKAAPPAAAPRAAPAAQAPAAQHPDAPMEPDVGQMAATARAQGMAASPPGTEVTARAEVSGTRRRPVETGDVAPGTQRHDLAAPAAEFEMTLPDGRTVAVGGHQERKDAGAYRAEQQAQRLESMAKLSLPPIDKTYFQTVAELVRKQVINPDEAKHQIEFFMTLKSNEDKYKLMAQAATQRAQVQQTIARANIGERQAGTDLQEDKFIDSQGDRILQKQGITHTIADLADAKANLEGIDGNGILQGTTLTKIAQNAQKGVLSDKDFDRMVGRSGAFAEFLNLINTKTTGKLSSEVRDNYAKVINHQLRQAEVRVHNAEKAYVRHAMTDPRWAKSPDLVISKHAELFGEMPGFVPLDPSIIGSRAHQPTRRPAPSTKTAKSGSVSVTAPATAGGADIADLMKALKDFTNDDEKK